MKTCRQHQQGVALVVTLIMLSVITFLVVAFLLMTNRDRAATNIKSIQTDNKNAEQSALNHAIASIVANVISRSNAIGFDYLVSTNFINPQGFRAGLVPVDSLTNVGYTYPNGQPVRGNDQLQNLANLYFSPRPPVYVDTNFDGAADEFRYYLDFNRNRAIETNGTIMEIDNAGVSIGRTNYHLGDPEWIGQLSNPNLPHSGTNRFLSRFAYLIFPVGKTLDLNVIHNQAKQRGTAAEGFYRNQGVGTYEINLAAFLNDLNTNVWPTSLGAYAPDATAPSAGLAYDDALNLVRYRYNGDYITGLHPISQIMGGNAAATLANNYVDDYADGGYVADRYAYSTGAAREDDPTRSWPGSPSTNAYWDLQELFYTNRVYSNFVFRLLRAGTNQSTYDRYTYYRLLSQLGTETTARTDNKLNINYANRGTNVYTNLVYWAPVEFFTNAAVEMIRQAGFNFALSNNTFNIEVYPTNRYSSHLHRILQVAANIYDATTNSPYPSVFRPIYAVEGSNVFIRRYVQEHVAANLTPLANWVELSDPTGRGRLGAPTGTNLSVYGIPLVVGARKGLPNFNELNLDSVFQITRKLEVWKPGTNAARSTWQTNQMIIAGISNVFGLEAWNSYSRPYSNAVQLIARLESTFFMTNEVGEIIAPGGGLPRRPATRTFAINQVIPANTWLGGQFRVLLNTNWVVLSNSIYEGLLVPPEFSPTLVVPFARGSRFPAPTWGLSVSNRLHYFLLENGTGRILDFANLTAVSGMDIIRELTSTNKKPVLRDIWLTNWVAGASGLYPLNRGVLEQIEISRGARFVDKNDWDSFRPTPVTTWESRATAMRDFEIFLNPQNYVGSTNTILNSRTNEAPFAPNAKIVQHMDWQVNDPIVHYHIDDYAFNSNATYITVYEAVPTNGDLGRTNSSYFPWNKGTTSTKTNLLVKDPALFSSDDWDFPTNKFPTVGWLGRVHRGTPWQSIFFKAGMATPADWRTVGKTMFSHPTNDWNLADLFSTSPSVLTAQGQLSINQTNLAAWSAVLSGVSILSNNVIDLRSRAGVGPTVGDGLQIGFIEPSSPQLLFLVESINRARLAKTNQTFTALRDILTIPELTTASPFLYITNLNRVNEKGINDAAYERIPQQILSLLRVGESRFVVYAFGQALRPAPSSVISRPGPFFQLVTNYAIAGEVVSKAVVRLEGAPNRPRVVVESYKILSPE